MVDTSENQAIEPSTAAPVGQRERIFPEPSDGHLFTRTVVYAYARTSQREEDEGGDNEGQIAEIVSYVNRNRIAIEQFYVDRGVRLFEGNPQRPRQPQINLERLFNDLARDPRPNKVIMATNVRRFCRNRQRGIYLFNRARELGVHFSTIQEGHFPLTEDGERSWLERCRDGEENNDQRSSGTQSGMTVARQQGRHVNRIPWGFTLDENGHLIINDYYRPALATLYSLLAQQLPIDTVVTKMSEVHEWCHPQETTKRGYRNRVYSILRDTRFTGFDAEDNPIKDYVLSPNCRGAISMRAWTELQILYREPVAYPQNFYLADILICGTCGKHMFGVETPSYVFTTKGEPHLRKQYYRCRGGSGACQPSNYWELRGIHEQADELVVARANYLRTPSLIERWHKVLPEGRQAFMREVFQRGVRVLPNGELKKPGWAR